LKLKVIGWDPVGEVHICQDEKGKERRVDLEVGARGDGLPLKRKDLIGKTVEVEYVFPYIELAMDPIEIVEEVVS
jgi:hypothetical protein